MHESDLPIRRRVVRARPTREPEEAAELWHRRLAWGIPVVALFTALVGVLAILGPPFPSPGQGVRKVPPTAPSAARPSQAAGAWSRPSWSSSP
jgi:hypothetical protein